VQASDAREKEIPKMFKIAAIIGGVLLLAGVALAGTVTSLDTTNSPSIANLPAASTTTATTATTAEPDDRGREREARGRANEGGEDLRGPCDEAEHANDPRCTGVAGTAPVTTVDDDDDRRGPNRGHDDGDDHGGNSGPGGGGESGHGGHGDDD
jgi:hypothetical protein